MLYIMRHGKTEWNALHKIQGRTDIPLNEEGKLMGLTGNRRMENGDVLAGTFFICADDGQGGDISLTEEKKYQ